MKLSRTLIIIIVLTVCSVFVNSASVAPDYDNIEFEINITKEYNAPDYDDVPFVIGEVVGPTDSCTYTSGDWDVDCADNCLITGDVDVGGNDINIIGVGTFTNEADITNWETLRVEGVNSSNICIVKSQNGGGFKD